MLQPLFAFLHLQQVQVIAQSPQRRATSKSVHFGRRPMPTVSFSEMNRFHKIETHECIAARLLNAHIERTYIMIKWLHDVQQTCEDDWDWALTLERLSAGVSSVAGPKQ